MFLTVEVVEGYLLKMFKDFPPLLEMCFRIKLNYCRFYNIPNYSFQEIFKMMSHLEKYFFKASTM